MVELRAEDLTVESLPHRRCPGLLVHQASPGIRITHKPTGTVIEEVSERSQLRNRVKALARLRASLEVE